jgi:hypothetical protein
MTGNVQEKGPVEFGWFDRLILLPTLMHLSVLASCPDGDIRIARMFGLLMWLSFSWEAILFSNAAHIMLSSDGALHVGLLAVAILMATILLLADATLFIGSSWDSQGQAELERTHEFELPTSRASKIKAACLVGGRFTMAILIASFMATTTALLAFEKDIDQILKNKYLSANAVLFTEAAQRENVVLEKNKNAQQEFGGLILQAEAEEKDLRSLSLEPKVDDSELKLALQRVATAQEAKVSADAELKNAEVFSSRERGGDCRAGGAVSCMPGEGPRWRAAQERIDSAERNATDASRTLSEAQGNLRTLVDARNAEARRKETLAETRLAEVTSRKGDLERQVGALKDAYDTRVAAREATIRNAVERDPRHTPRGTGLLGRLQALNELSKDEAIAHALFGFDAILILLELAAIMGKTFVLIPMEYSTRVVERDLVREIETAKRLKAKLKGDLLAPPEPIAVAPDLPKPDIAAPVSVEPRPLNGTADRTRRHAARWRPDLNGGLTEPPKQS